MPYNGTRIKNEDAMSNEIANILHQSFPGASDEQIAAACAKIEQIQKPTKVITQTIKAHNRTFVAFAGNEAGHEAACVFVSADGERGQQESAAHYLLAEEGFTQTRPTQEVRDLLLIPVAQGR